MAAPAPASYASTLALARALAHRAALQLLARPPAPAQAFALFLQAAQAFVRAGRLAPLDERAGVQRELRSALDNAERCKAAVEGRGKEEGQVRRPAGKGPCDPDLQQDVLLQSATIAAPWGLVVLPLASPFLPVRAPLPNPPLPAWSAGAYAPPPQSGLDALWLPNGASPDVIQQDRVANCSFVVSLQVLVAWNRRHGRKQGKDLLAPLLTPSTSDPTLFKLTLNLNGAQRSTFLDHLLPLTSSGAPVGIACDGADVREGEGWVLQLLEKGWMALRGGWDGAGSNSSVDLHALTGWVPEVVSLRDSAFKREQTWSRLRASVEQGSCLMSLGTGLLNKTQVKETGLISRHDYSVLDLVEHDGKRLVHVLNPWKRKARLQGDGTAYDASTSEVALDVIPEETGWSADLRSALDVVGNERVFSMPWEVVVQVFDAIYLNWDPEMFGSVQTVHSQWAASATSSASPPQFQLRCLDARPIWLYLQRHMAQIDSTSSSAQQLTFIGIEVLEVDGSGQSGLAEKTVYTDSAHHLVKISPTRAGSTFTLLPVHDAAAASACRFTLSAYSAGTGALKLTDPPPDLPYTTRVDGAFAGRTAGGSPAWPSFMDSPMFALDVQSSSTPGSGTALADLRLSVKTRTVSDENEHVPVNAKVVWGKGQRITQLVRSDVIVDSGAYRRERALCAKDGLQSGVYTVILSTHKPGQECDFELEVQCTAPISLRPIPQEGAGLFSRTYSGSWSATPSFGSPTFGKYWRNPTFDLRLHQDADVLLRICSTSRSGSPDPPPSLPLNITIFALPSSSSSSPLGAEVVSSGPYTDAVAGASVPRQRLKAGAYRVVASCYSPGAEGAFALRVYSDRAFDWARRSA